jgi:transcription-repair coupling factor (superfamily II helicase)
VLAALAERAGHTWTGVGELERTLRSRGIAQAGGLWGATQALLLAAMMRRSDQPFAVALSSQTEAELFVQDLETFGCNAVHLPEREYGGGAAALDAASVRERLQVASKLARAESRPRCLVASLLSWLQPVPDPAEFERRALTLEVGGALDAEHLLRRLVDEGYERQPLVEAPGEVSLRGDILDLFPFASTWPLRVELLDGRIESLRTFEPASQRSRDVLRKMRLSLARDAGGIEDGSGPAPLTLLPTSTCYVEIERLRIEDRAHGLGLLSGSHQRALAHWKATLESRARLSLQSLPSRAVDFEIHSVQALAVGVRAAMAPLGEFASRGLEVHVLCANAAEARRFEGLVAEAQPPPAVRVGVGALSRGFRAESLGAVVLHHRELIGAQTALRSRERPVYRSRALQSFFELRPGDFVVHAVHGLALYRGLTRMQRAGGEEEHLHLEFEDEVSLFVPATRIDLVQRYIGGGRATPPLDKIGGQTFRRRREKVERALFDLAADLLEVQAKRELRRRPPWRPDASLVRDLLGSFPFVDTPDQVRADQEITADLSQEKPMDRLLCGDVGFGKTEIAVRAAFRVAACGGQVAVLVPTTLLAHQHHQAFRSRLADFPLRVEALSRSLSGKAEREIVEQVAAGAVDILIGTHRILSKDVCFARLGLVVLDEEQRFGVTHKEHFKRLREAVDVLALSATPIPRTLHMSLSGVRDISALSTPPAGRVAIQTRILEAEDHGQLRHILLAEKARGGQTFFLHNRVQSIEALARELRELVPECTLAVGHGQMPARQVEKIVDAFGRGEVDVLVATTIVENGLDVPEAGTIVIDGAHHFGLAELHQLRGRVGRGRHASVCYLRVPRSEPIPEVARERLKALEEMNQLGSGFAISMKDLELRGAGNLLGAEQSGHIGAVGYDMYCRLLKATVERVREGLPRDTELSTDELSSGVELELGLAAYLPAEWIPQESTRLEILRLLDGIHSVAQTAEVRRELHDRFGRIPEPAEQLIKSFELRALALPLSIRRIAWRQDCYLIEFRDRVSLEQALGARSDVELRTLRTGLGQLVLPRAVRTSAQGLAWLERVLKGEREPSRMGRIDRPSR